jgi:hypothetical protein
VQRWKEWGVQAPLSNVSGGTEQKRSARVEVGREGKLVLAGEKEGRKEGRREGGQEDGIGWGTKQQL